VCWWQVGRHRLHDFHWEFKIWNALTTEQFSTLPLSPTIMRHVAAIHLKMSKYLFMKKKKVSLLTFNMFSMFNCDNIGLWDLQIIGFCFFILYSVPLTVFHFCVQDFVGGWELVYACTTSDHRKDSPLRWPFYVCSLRNFHCRQLGWTNNLLLPMVIPN